jgi:hypothetical protein
VLRFLDVHHEGEDALLFPILLERDPDDAARIAGIAAQHADVITALATARQAVDAFGATPGTETRQAAATALATLEAGLEPHLDDEEAVIVPLAAQHMTMEEWGALPAHGMGNFTGDKIWLILGLIRENMTPQQRDDMLAHMPPPAVDMWLNMGNAAFDTMIAEVRQDS